MLQDAVDVHARLDVNRDDVRAGRDVIAERGEGVADHQVDVLQQRRPDRADDRRPDGHRRGEAAVHDVDVQQRHADLLEHADAERGGRGAQAGDS